MSELTLIDLFCGAGGFSEGFRQQGFKVLMGIDKWRPAIDTFNHNFDLNCMVGDVLGFEGSIEKIEALPDTTVIVGSPPCVSFSSSNRSGKADKSMGIRLTEAFFRVIAVKKHQPGSVLKAWFMENVTKSKGHLEPTYTFRDLKLEEWALKHQKDPNAIAITLTDNQVVINSAEYGSPQARRRLITGEIIAQQRLVVPPVLYRSPEDEGSHLPVYRTLNSIRDNFPKPNDAFSTEVVSDPLYPHIKLPKFKITDHYYDTGLYHSEWKNSKFLKENHPYMGVMSFPENGSKPSRTITATKIGTSREAVIYRSEYNRVKDGEYRTPTVREAATLMSFPITYQFIGAEGAKWRLAGNAVCPSVSRAIAASVRSAMNLPRITTPIVQQEPDLTEVLNLNDYKQKIFDQPKTRNTGSRFRRHPFKHGNITVTLSNYDIEKNEKEHTGWLTSVQYGNGEGFPSNNFADNYYPNMEPVIAKFKNGPRFLEIINNGFTEKIAGAALLQRMYEDQNGQGQYLEPTALIEKVAEIICSLDAGEVFEQSSNTIFPDKQSVPQSQVMALYAVNKICTVANYQIEQ